MKLRRLVIQDCLGHQKYNLKVQSSINLNKFVGMEKGQEIIKEASCVLKVYGICTLYPFITIYMNENLDW